MVRGWNKALRGREQNGLQRIFQSFKAADWVRPRELQGEWEERKEMGTEKQRKEKNNSMRLREAQANSGINS